MKKIVRCDRSEQRMMITRSKLKAAQIVARSMRTSRRRELWLALADIDRVIHNGGEENKYGHIEI